MPATPLTARARIVGWMTLLVALALAASVVGATQVLAERADAMATDSLTHRATGFRAFAESAVGRSHSSVDALLTDYLVTTAPTAGATAFTLVDGVPGRRSSGTPPARLDTDPAFLTRVAGATTPTSGWWASPAGTVRYGVLPVSVENDPHTGALVLAEFRDVQARPLFDALRVISVIAAGALVLAALAGWLVAGRVLEPVRLVRQAARRISEDDLDERIAVDGDDDVAQLAHTVNAMLDRLQGSFETQRRFIDDTAHELRTPITIVRGHLELLADDAADLGPTDLADTRALVLDELTRMGRIVEDLTVLAKSERPDFLAPTEVDLADLTVDAVDKARVLADRRWALDAVAEGVVRVDGQRLTQALMQLASNAVRHTAPGDRIAIGSSRRGTELTLWVRDSGRGVDPEDAPHIFERFRRGAGSRRVDGAGLGLSIVASIARAHGGVARLVERPGPGATFTIELPVRADQPVEATTATHDDARGAR